MCKFFFSIILIFMGNNLLSMDCCWRKKIPRSQDQPHIRVTPDDDSVISIATSPRQRKSSQSSARGPGVVRVSSKKGNVSPNVHSARRALSPASDSPIRGAIGGSPDRYRQDTPMSRSVRRVKRSSAPDMINAAVDMIKNLDPQDASTQEQKDAMLRLAVIAGQQAVVKELLIGKANLYAMNDAGNSAIALASQNQGDPRMDEIRKHCAERAHARVLSSDSKESLGVNLRS